MDSLSFYSYVWDTLNVEQLHIISLTYLYSGPPYLLEGASQGGHPELVLKAYIIFCLLTCDIFDVMIMYSAAPPCKHGLH